MKRPAAIVSGIKAGQTDVPSSVPQLHSSMNVWRREHRTLRRKSHFTKSRREMDIFGNLLGLGLGPITGQKKGLPSPRAEAGQGNI